MKIIFSIIFLLVLKTANVTAYFKNDDTVEFIYKQSQHTTILKRLGSRQKSFTKTNENVEIVSDYSNINSIKDLSKIFKRKTVFIDLWATWCPACFDEFRFKKNLGDFLNKKNIELLYVSFDNDSLDKTWRRVIVEQNLKGKHIRSTKALQDDITTLIWGGKDAYSIPHYMLLSKGKIVGKTMFEPHDQNKLYLQIDSVLRKVK